MQEETPVAVKEVSEGRARRERIERDTAMMVRMGMGAREASTKYTL